MHTQAHTCAHAHTVTHTHSHTHSHTISLSCTHTVWTDSMLLYRECLPVFSLPDQEKLLTLKKTQSWLANLTLAEIGIDENGKVLEEMPPMPEELKPKEKPKSKSTKTV